MRIDSPLPSEKSSVNLDEYELDPNYAKGLIDAVLDCFSDTASEAVLKEKPIPLTAERLQEIPDFELKDILGDLEIDELGNFILL